MSGIQAAHEDTLVEDPRATGKQVARDVCAALGIPFYQVRSIKLNIEAGSPAVVVVERFLTRSESQGIKAKLEEYTLAKVIELDDE